MIAGINWAWEIAGILGRTEGVMYHAPTGNVPTAVRSESFLSIRLGLGSRASLAALRA
jgi:hypothetical protein